jgi:hypothetical protein
MSRQTEIPAILSLQRYFLSANRMRKLYEEAIQSAEHQERRRTLAPDIFAAYLHSGPASVVYYWYGALYVVTEGYNELRLCDAQVDALLADTAKVLALRRCRNGEFHFQKNTSTSGSLNSCARTASLLGSAILLTH